MFVGVLVFVGQVDVEFDSLDGALGPAMGMEMVPIQPQLAKLGLQIRQVNPEVEERPNHHVPADAAKNIEIKRPHEMSPRWASALICEAANPPPNPLSMLVTVTPLPQLVSIPSNAAKPFIAAP